MPVLDIDLAAVKASPIGSERYVLERSVGLACPAIRGVEKA